MKRLRPNSDEILGDSISVGGFELTVAGYRGSYVPVAFHTGLSPKQLALATATLTRTEAKMRMIPWVVRFAEEGG